MIGNDELLLTDECRTLVHPIVLFSILEHFNRRTNKDARVIGTLLGNDKKRGVVEVHDSFPVPHTEQDQVAVDMAFLRHMLSLKQRTSPGVQIVGWYATGLKIDQSSAMIHKFFAKEMSDKGKPLVHVTLDTGLTGGRMSINAFVRSELSLGSSLGSFFQPVSVELTSFEAAKISLSQMAATIDDDASFPPPLRVNKPKARAEGDDAAADAEVEYNEADARLGTPSVPLASDMGAVEASMRRMSQMLQVVRERVKRIVAGEEPADHEFGAKLVELLKTIPKLDSATFDQTFAREDLLMASYLASLTNAQLALSEKISVI